MSDLRRTPRSPRIDLTTRRRRFVAWVMRCVLRVYERGASWLFVQVTPPGEDPFYTALEDLEALRPGEVLDARAVEIRMLRHRVKADAWHVRFRSTDAGGGAVSAVATVVVPRRAFAGPVRPLLSYQCAIDSLGAGADPSYGLRRGAQLELPFIARALRRGWAVVTADYTGPEHAFGVGPLAGRLVLDGIRAALAHEPAGIDAAAPIGLWGYSGGAQATLFAAELHPTYAPELRLAGAAAGGITGDDTTSLEHHLEVGTLFSGVWFGAVIGICRGFDVDLVGAATPEGRALLASADEMTFEQLLLSFPFLRLGDYLTVPGVLAVPGLKAALDANRFRQGSPTTELHLYHSVHDQNRTIAEVEELVETYRRGGAEVAFRPYRFGEHMVAAVTGTRGALRFLSGRLGPP